MRQPTAGAVVDRLRALRIDSRKQVLLQSPGTATRPLGALPRTINPQSQSPDPSPDDDLEWWTLVVALAVRGDDPEPELVSTRRERANR